MKFTITKKTNMIKKATQNAFLDFNSDVNAMGTNFVQDNNNVLIELLQKQSDLTEIWKNDPEPEILIDKYEGEIPWSISVIGNNNGIEFVTLKAKPTTLMVKGRINHFTSNNQDDIKTTQFSVEIKIDTIKIVEPDCILSSSIGLYPVRLELLGENKAELYFE